MKYKLIKRSENEILSVAVLKINDVLSKVKGLKQYMGFSYTDKNLICYYI